MGTPMMGISSPTCFEIRIYLQIPMGTVDWRLASHLHRITIWNEP